jgi:hypothetical protein
MGKPRFKIDPDGRVGVFITYDVQATPSEVHWAALDTDVIELPPEVTREMLAAALIDGQIGLLELNFRCKVERRRGTPSPMDSAIDPGLVGLLDQPVNWLFSQHPLSSRAWKVLRHWAEEEPQRLRTVGDLTRLTSRDVLRRKNCGRRTLHEIEAMLELHGLALSGRRNGW